MGYDYATSGYTRWYWTSPDGKTRRQVVWTKGDVGLLDVGGNVVGDGTRILGLGIENGGKPGFWVWTSSGSWNQLVLDGDMDTILASNRNVRRFLLDNGVLFVTPEGGWFGQAWSKSKPSRIARGSPSPVLRSRPSRR